MNKRQIQFVVAKALLAFHSQSDAIQDGILEMARIVTDSTSTDDEEQAAWDTLHEGLFPSDPVDW